MYRSMAIAKVYGKSARPPTSRVHLIFLSVFVKMVGKSVSTTALPLATEHNLVKRQHMAIDLQHILRLVNPLMS